MTNHTAGNDMFHKMSSRARSASRLMMVFLAGSCTLAAAQSGPAGDANHLELALLTRNVFIQAQKDAGAEPWGRIPEHSVLLHPAPAVHPSIALHQTANQDGQPLSLRVSVISDGEHLCFRLRWNDATENRTSLMGEYRDAAALQFPLGTEASSIMMGSPDAPVSIWFWKADTNDAETLIAGGPGSVSSSSGGSEARGVHSQRSDGHAGQWLVVFSRTLHDAGAENLALDRRSSLPVAFAVWRGEAEQRDGHKYVSGWHELRLDSLHGAR